MGGASKTPVVLLLALVLSLSFTAAGEAFAQPLPLTTESTKNISSLTIEGLRRIPAETLMATIPLKKGQQVTEMQLPRLARKSVKAIFATGYFSDVKVYTKEDAEGRLMLTFVVLEKYVVGKINVVGYEELEEEDVHKALSVRTGRFLDSSKLIETLRSIEELYQDKGFYLAEASYEVVKEESNRTAAVTFTIKEQAEMAVRRINFVGNTSVTDDDLRAIMMTREKGYLSFLQEGGLFLNYFFQLERPGAGLSSGYVDGMSATDFESWSAKQDVDLQRVKWFFMTKGYVEVKLGQPRMTLTPDKEGIIVTVDVEEGGQFNVGDVSIVSDDEDGLLFDKEVLYKELKLVKGQLFDAQNVMMDTELLSRMYMNKGYAFVSVSNSHFLDKNNGVLSLTYVVDKGNPTYVANIELVGNETTADKVVRREMRIAEGDLFHQDKVDRSKALIYRLGFFEEVEIAHKPTFSPSVAKAQGTADQEIDYVDIVVKVKERDTGIFQIGAGFSSLESYILQARVQKNNFLGRGQTVSFQALISSLRSIYMISFVEPYFFDTPISFSFDVYNMSTEFEAWTKNALGGSLTLGYRFLDDYFVYLSYKAERMSTELGGLKGYGSVPFERLPPQGVTTSLRLTAAWDTRNNRVMPTKGSYNSGWFEWASPYLGGDSDFYRIGLNSRWYIPMFWNLILRLNGRLGYIGTASNQGIPIYERYYVGGIFSVRGFQRNSLSPTIPAAAASDPGTDLIEFPLGGNKQLIFNVEIEIPIYRQMGIVAVLFFDAGNAFAEGENLSIVDLRTSVGFGFRWWSPMGPLRFEWGFPLSPEEGEEPMVFQFTIGSAF